MNIYHAVALTILLLSGGCLKGDSGQNDTPPPAVLVPILKLSNINVTTGANIANITWTTNVPSDSIVRYGMVSGKYNMAEGSRDYVTEHNITIQGLIPGNTYYYKIGSIDPDGIASQSREYNFMTTILPSPIISNISVIPASTSALIEWTTDIPSDSIVNYGTATEDYNKLAVSEDYVTEHSIAIEGLFPGNSYYYVVGSTDPNGVFNESEEFKFKAIPAKGRERIIDGDLEVYLRNFGFYSLERGNVISYYSRVELSITNMGEEKLPVTITSTAIVDNLGYQSDMVSIGAPDEFRSTEIFPGGKVIRALYYERILGTSGTVYMSINSKSYQFQVP